ncbi:MAG: hypothetical protein K9I85_12340 [Saprospiraceae bacterium]|nr:hypothetical protein [Saprospiraceae bacterium]
MLALFGLLILFHCFVIAGWISPKSVWGERVQSDQDLIHVELASISMLFLYAMIVMAKVNIIDMDWIKPLAQLGLWMMAIYFVITSVTNAMGDTNLERFLFAPVALVLAILTVRLALIKTNHPPARDTI